MPRSRYVSSSPSEEQLRAVGRGHRLQRRVLRGAAAWQDRGEQCLGAPGGSFRVRGLQADGGEGGAVTACGRAGVDEDADGTLLPLVALAAIPLWAALSDRIGRRPVYLIRAVGSAVTMFLYLWAISSGSYPLILLTGIVAFGVVYSAANGVWPSFYGEMFSTRVRMSGMAIGPQIGFAVAGFAVTFAAEIAGPDGTDWSSVALFTAALCVPPVIAACSARETHEVPTERLGEPASGEAAQPQKVPA